MQVELKKPSSMSSSMIENIQNICIDTAQQLADIPHVISTTLHQQNWLPYVQASLWSPTTLAYGFPGLICCFSEMHHFFPHQKWDHISNQCIEKLVAEIKTQGIPNESLFSGYAGICFALDTASQENQLYKRLRSQLHNTLLEKISIHYLQPIQDQIKASQPVHPHLYDAVSGVVGILAYLLNHANEKETASCIVDILKVLVGLTEPKQIDGVEVPGWFIAAKDITSTRGDMTHTLGSFDTGLAHGVSGCLVIFAKALLQGFNVPGQIQAIQRIVNWLKAQRIDIDCFKEVWPSLVLFQNNQEVIPRSSFYRDGWCYGAPGIIFSLFFASCALKDSSLYDYAVDAMKAVCERFATQNTLTCPAICHGLSGLLAMTHQFYLATKSEIFFETSMSVCEEILKQYNKDFPFKFKVNFMNNNEKQFKDNPGFIDGTAGVVLSLLFQLSERPRPWLQSFLIG